MKKVILILDDNEDRLTAMKSLLVEPYPQYRIVLFDNAPDTIEWLKENLSSVVVMSLDHDLGPNRERDGQVFDPGTGKDVVDFLGTQKPVCPLLVHSSNYEGRNRMKFSLEAAGWVTSFAIPHDELEWIYDTWRQEIFKFLYNIENSNRNISQKELKRILAGEITRQQLRELRFILQEWEPDDVFHSLFWLALKGDLYPCDFSASYLLVDLDPLCPMDCKEALLAIAGSRLNLSNRLVPFYLVTQFGKRKVISAYRELVMTEFDHGVPNSLASIQYWISAPALELVKSYVLRRESPPEATEC